jgi:hypothetical protein
MIAVNGSLSAISDTVSTVSGTILDWLPNYGPSYPVQSGFFPVSPERANQLLTLNTANCRQIDYKRTTDLAQAIRDGQWEMTHQGVALSREGVLLDGQHRLYAISQAGVTVPIMITWNLPDKVKGVIDTGSKRTNRQILQGSVDKRVVESLTAFCRLHGMRYPQAAALEKMAGEQLGQAMLNLVNISGRSARARSSAGVKVAASLRFLQYPEYVSQQWRAFLLLDFAEMSNSIQALTRQLTDDTRRTTCEDRMARAWVAFDRERANISRIQVVDLSKTLDEIRRAYRPGWVVSE